MVISGDSSLLLLRTRFPTKPGGRLQYTQTLQTQDVINQVPFIEKYTGFYSTLFVVCEGWWLCPVADLKSLNCFTLLGNFKTEFIQTVQPNVDAIAGSSGSYFHISSFFILSKICIAISQMHLQFNHLPFGLCCLWEMFAKVLSAIWAPENSVSGFTSTWTTFFF